MSSPRFLPEHPPGFLPLGELSVLRSATAWQLLIPADTYSALVTSRQISGEGAEPKEEIPGWTPESPPTAEQQAQTPRRPKPRHVQIFDPESLEQARERLRAGERDQQRYGLTLLDQAKHDGGYRALPRLRSALNRLDASRPLFGNLREPIEKLKIDLTLVSAMRSKDFRIRPMLLTGQPGVGKTQFALKLAEILGVPMQKWSAGSAQAGFQLTGGDGAWRSARPGMIFEMLAKGTSAAPVFVFDEVDKISSDNRYSVTAVLLDLLEAGTARTFEDSFLRATFDASRIIHVLTANDLDAVPPALLSRVEVFDIPPPAAEQRLQIILSEAQRLWRATGHRIELDIHAAEALAERCDLDLRRTQRLVVDAFATAMASGKHIATPTVSGRARRRAIGFAADSQADKKASGGAQ